MTTVQTLTNGEATVDPGLRLADAQSLGQAIAFGQGRQSTKGLTASTTQTQAAGTKLQSGLNSVSSVANGSDACTMPQAKPGAVILIANNGGNTMDLFPFLGDTINDAVKNAAVSVADNTLSVYICTTAGLWFGGAITFET